MTDQPAGIEQTQLIDPSLGIEGVRNYQRALAPDEPPAPNPHAERLAEYPPILHPVINAALSAPHSADAWQALANRAQDVQYVGLSDQAAMRAAILEPDNANGLNVFAWSQYNQCRHELAWKTFERVQCYNPRHPGPYAGKSVIAFDQDDVAEAIQQAKTAVRLEPGNHEARKALSRAQQTAGADLPEAWNHWEYRRKSANHPVRLWLPRTRWDGKKMPKGSTLLIVNEDGLGDEIQTLPWLHWLDERCAKWGYNLIIEADPRLVPTFRATFPTATIVPVSRYGNAGGIYQRYDHVWPKPDAWLEAWSIPHVCQQPVPPARPYTNHLVNLPGKSRYISRDADAFVGRAVANDLKVIGFAFTTSIMSSIRQRYYPPVDEFRRLIETPGTAWINFQYGETVAANAIEGDNVMSCEEFGVHDRTHDIAGLFRALENCDMVISPRSSIAWMAAAVGTETLTLRCRPTRYKLGTDHFPGWPSMRSIDKNVDEPWSPVFDAVIQEIEP